MPNQSEFIEQAAPMRAELLAHCYRMLGSVHEAEESQWCCQATAAVVVGW